MNEIDQIIKLFQALPEFRQAECVEQMLRCLNFPEYDNLIEEMGWIDWEGVDNLRTDLSYWRETAARYETTMEAIADVLEKAGVHPTG